MKSREMRFRRRAVPCRSRDTRNMLRDDGARTIDAVTGRPARIFGTCRLPGVPSGSAATPG
jgi:hypothetical protein